MAASGWYVDPTGRHEQRYFDGREWTRFVADRGQMAAEPLNLPVSRPPRPVGPAGAVVPPPPGAGQSAGESVSESFKKVGKWVDKRMQTAVVRVAQRGSSVQPSDVPVLEREPSSELLGQWSGLATSVQKLVVATSGVPAANEVVGVLRAVTGSEEAQGRLLSSIDAKVDALVKGPYNTGRTYLREAQRLGADDPDAPRRIERARECFYLAHGQAASVQSRSLVEYHIGLTWLLLGRPDDAVHWLAQCHASTVAVVEELARCSENVQVLRSKGGVAAAAYFYPAGAVVLGMKFKKMVAAERARQALVDVLPFVECAARSHNSLVPEADRLPTLSLRSTGEHRFELVPVIPT